MSRSHERGLFDGQTFEKILMMPDEKLHRRVLQRKHVPMSGTLSGHEKTSESNLGVLQGLESRALILSKDDCAEDQAQVRSRHLVDRLVLHDARKVLAQHLECRLLRRRESSDPAYKRRDSRVRRCCVFRGKVLAAVPESRQGMPIRGRGE